MKLIEKVIGIAWGNYNEDTFYHVMCVVAYVVNDNLIPDDKKETALF